MLFLVDIFINKKYQIVQNKICLFVRPVWKPSVASYKDHK